MSRVLANKIVAYQQYVEKLEKNIRGLLLYGIIVTCIAVGLSAYIVWTVT